MDEQVSDGQKAKIQEATKIAAIGAGATAVLSALVSPDRPAGFLVGGALGWVVAGTAGYLYVDWRVKKAVEAIFS
jgi:hypothetical protein